MVGLGLLVWSLIEAPAGGWTNGIILGAFLAALVVLGGFVRYELRVGPPVLDVRFFLNPRFTAANISITFLFFALTGFIFGVAQYLQRQADLHRPGRYFGRFWGGSPGERGGAPTHHARRRSSWRGASRRCPGGYVDQSRSNRSRFMTLSQAATKSRTNFSLASSHA